MKRKIPVIISGVLAVGIAVCSGFYLNDDKEQVKSVANDARTIDTAAVPSSKKNGWGIKKNKNSPPDVPEDIKGMLRKYNSFYMDNSGEKTLFLTFDEGYENGYTGQILDTLKKCEVKAAFFVTKPYLEKETELVKRMIDEGHIVGNHTMNHPDMTTLSDEKIGEELNGLNKIYNEMYGGEMKYMRPPEGAFSERVLSAANNLGYKTVFWSFAYKDWDVNSFKGADFAYNQITPYIHDGAVILLHAVSKDNADVLERVINYAKGEGYTFSSLDSITQ